MGLKITTSTKSLLTLTIIGLSLAGCKKDFNSKKEATVIEQSNEQVIADQKIVKYLVITLGVESNEISFDKSSNNFIIRGQKFNKDSVVTHYSRANEYKLNFENQ